MNDQLSILILDHFNCHGGAQEYAIDIAMGLKENDVQVYLPTIDITSLSEMATGISTTNFPLLAEKPLSFQFIFRFLKNIFQLKLFIQKNRVDVFHCNSIPVLLLAKLTRKKQPIIYAYHISHKSKIKRAIINLCCDSIIYVSNAMKEEAELGGANKPSRIIYNGLYSFKTHPSKRDKIVFGIPGRITEEKGILLFIEAAKITSKTYSNVEFHIIGRHESEDFFNTVQQRICSTKEIKLIPFYTNKQELYSSLDVVVNATIINEPLGRTLIEAGIASLPVIAPAKAGPLEIVEDTVSGLFFTPEDSQSLSSAMKILIDSASKRENMGKEGRLIFEKKFSIQSISEQLINFYTENRNDK